MRALETSLYIWDAFKIGVKGTNAMFLGTGIDMMDKALEKAVVEGVSSPAFIEELDVRVLRNLIKTSKRSSAAKPDRHGLEDHKVMPNEFLP